MPITRLNGGWSSGSLVFKNDSGDTLYTFEHDGTLLLSNDAVTWDDMQVNISRIRVPAVNAPTERLYNHGIGGGVTFPVLGFAVDDYIYYDIQTSHRMKLNSIIDHHIHYMTPNDGTGKKFKFQLDIIACGIEGTWSAPTGSPFTAEKSMDGDYSDKHKLFNIADVPAANTTISTIYSCKLTRIAASSDEYASEVYLKFIDSHFQVDTQGSREEYSK